MDRSDALWGVGGALAIGVVTTATGVVGLLAGLSTLSVSASVVARAMLTAVGLAVVVIALARRGPWERVGPLLLVAAIGYPLDLMTWTAGGEAGGALIGVPLTSSALAGVVVDLVLWLAVAAGAAALGLRSRFGADG